MVMISSKLASELESMVPVDTEAEGINNFATAFENYFSDSTVVGMPVNSGSLTAAISALKSAMSGANSDAALAIQNGIIAFWSIIETAFVTIWTTAPPLISATPPTGLGTISSTLSGVFASNVESEVSLSEASINIANALHPIQLGGIAVIGPPPPGGVPTPIL